MSSSEVPQADYEPDPSHRSKTFSPFVRSYDATPLSFGAHGSGDNVYDPPSEAEGSKIRTTLDVAILQERGIERSKSERNDQSEPSHSPSQLHRR